MGNTNATQSMRTKWMGTLLQETLQYALVAEKVCAVDRTDSYYIYNPYGSAPTTVVQTIVGTYVPATYTSTNDALTVTDEFIVSEHIYDFEKVMVRYDLYTSRMNEMVASVERAIDKYVLNFILTDGTGTYSTPSGGFTTPANIPVIISTLLSKVAGYSNIGGNGLYLVIEAGDTIGFYQYGVAAGFNFADAWLKNGWVGNVSGIDVYVVADDTFVSETMGSKTVAGSGHRVFGVKGLCTYAAPRDVQYEEKSIGGSTGKEIVVWGYIGCKVWAAKATKTVDITVTA